jgi:DNA-3-methyladenine glycosylase II
MAKTVRISEMEALTSMLDERSLARGLRYLAARDPDLALIHARLGTPPLWLRAPGFPTLVHIILEQQVSLASARAAYERLCALVVPLTPRRFLALDDATLKTVGFSRQKIAYVRHLARAINTREFDPAALARMPDETARAELIKLKGIGAWTADVYLLMGLGRPDAWPAGDLGLAVAAQRVKGLNARPTPAELETMSSAWRPWRAVAARLLWHFYLSRVA